MRSWVSSGKVHEAPTSFTFRGTLGSGGALVTDGGEVLRFSCFGASMEIRRDRLFQEWVKSWADETGLGVPCGEAQADGVPCFELDRDCSECQEAYEAWLEYRKKHGLADETQS
jgi:hypothetical protein